VEDPLHLRGQALRKTVGLAARELSASAAASLEEAVLGLVCHSRLTAALALDWGQPQAREQALRLVREEGDRGKMRAGAAPAPFGGGASHAGRHGHARPDWHAGHRTPDPEGGPGGKRLTKHGAPGRRLAREDADRRHGWQSSAKPFPGFQEHCVLDLESHVAREGVGCPAHEPEPEAVALLVETLAKPPGLQQLAIDLGDMTSPRRAQWAEQGVGIIARPWLQGGTRVTQDDGTCDCAPGHVTCPGGQTGPMSQAKTPSFQPTPVIGVHSECRAPQPSAAKGEAW